MEGQTCMTSLMNDTLGVGKFVSVASKLKKKIRKWDPNIKPVRDSNGGKFFGSSFLRILRVLKMGVMKWGPCTI